MSEYMRAQIIYENFNQTWQYGSTECDAGVLTVFQQHKGTCGTITAAYNLLLKTDGLLCGGQYNGSSHMWTVAILDGIKYHIDATWNSYLNFGLSAEAIYAESTGTHIWTKESRYIDFDGNLL